MIGPSPGLARSEQRWMRTANHWRSSDTSDAAGGVVRSWQLLGTVDVVFGIPGPAERATGDREGVDYDYNLKVPADAGVQRGDRLVVDDQSIEVTATPASSSAHLAVLRGRVEPWDEPLPADDELELTSPIVGQLVADLTLVGSLDADLILEGVLT